MLTPVPASTLAQRIAARAENLRSGPHRSGLAGDPMESLLDSQADYLDLLVEYHAQWGEQRAPLPQKDAQRIAAAAMRAALQPLIQVLARTIGPATVTVMALILAATLALGVWVGWVLRGSPSTAWGVASSSCEVRADGWKACPSTVYLRP